MRPQAGVGAGRLDVFGQAEGAAVIAIDRRGRMMAGDDDRALAFFVVFQPLQAFELAGEELQLLVADRIVVVLGGDHAGPLQHVGVEADDRDERRVQGEVDPGLGHRRAHQATPSGGGPARAAQKLRRKAISVGLGGAGGLRRITSPSWLPGIAKIGGS